MPTLNIHNLLAGTGNVDGFRQNISLTRAKEAHFARVRELVRDRLRSDFRTLNEAAPARRVPLLQKSLQTTDRAAALRLRPKFRWQGSFAYRTVNDPAHKPPQQVDMDDGVYLPTSFVNLQQPDVAADAFFTAVEGSLGPLCREHGWRLDTSTSSCVRVILDEESHLDLALYAIPDEDFAEERVLEKSLHSQGASLDQHAVMAQDRQVRILSEDQYRSLPTDRIMLAHRDGGWEPSDPRKLEFWFNGKKDEHGDVLRFTCRYLKAWRDHRWPVPKTGPSSICLMACTVTAFDEAATPPPDGRDDSALLMVAARLPSILARAIPNPAVDGASDLDADWTGEKRQEFIAQARDLYDSLLRAMAGPFHDHAVRHLRGSLGERVPDDHTLVSSEEEARILRTPPRTVAAPVVPRTTQG